VTADRLFRRSFDSLDEIFAFTADFFALHRIDPGLLPTVDLTLEELFTNMVKYSPAGEPNIRIEMAAAEGGVEVTLTDYDVERFDVTQAPDANIDLPIEVSVHVCPLTSVEMVRALGRLSVVHRQVLVLKYLDDWTVGQIAREIGRTEVQVQSLLQRARDGLRRADPVLQVFPCRRTVHSTDLVLANAPADGPACFVA